MPDQLNQPSLRGSGELSIILRGALKANLVHHLAHTGGAGVLRRIGRAWKPSWDWLPPGTAPAGDWELIRRGWQRLCSVPTAELTPGDAGFSDLEEAVRREPAALWAWVGLGLHRLRLWEGEVHFQKALEAFQKAAALRPDWAWGPLLVSEALRSLLDYEGALRELDRAIALDPGLAWAYAFKARVYFQSRTRPDDMDWMDRALSLSTKEGWMHAWRAEGFRRLGKYRQAAPIFERALRLDPLYDQGFCWRARMLEAQGRPGAAVHSLDRGIALCPGFEKAYRQKVRALRALGRTGEALKTLEAAVRLNHRNDWLGAWRAEGTGPGPAAEKALAELRDYIPETRGSEKARALAWFGETLGQLGRHEEALAELDAALALEPNFAWAHAWKGESLSALGRPDSARAALDRSLELDPAYGRAWAWRGRVRADRGDWVGAESDFDKSLSIRRIEYAWILAWRGEARSALGRAEEAVRDLTGALGLDRQPKFHYWRGKALLALGREAAGRRDLLLAQALAAPQTDAFPWKELLSAEEFRRSGDPREALRLLAPIVLRHGPKRPWLYLLRYRLKRELNLGAQVRDVDLAFRKDPACAWPLGLAPLPPGSGPRERVLEDETFADRPEAGPLYAYRGQAALQRGKTDEGLADLKRAAELEPAGWILAWLGEARRAAGKTAEALRDFDAALSLDPRYPNAWAWRGTAKLQAGDAAGALADLGRALAMAPTARAFRDRARALRRLGRPVEALDDLAQAVARNAEWTWDLAGPGDLEKSLAELDALCAEHPKESRFQAWRGETLARLGRLDEALAALNLCLKKSSWAWALCWRGEVLLRRDGPTPAALRDLKAATRRAPRYARAHASLGEALARAGQRVQALGTLTRALRLNPYSARLWVSRGTLRLDLGKRAAAAPDAARALALCPNYPEASALLARARGETPAAEGPSLEFFVNYACNAKCPFCFNPPDASAELERGLPFAELARRLYAGFGEGYRGVKFIGGEVTVREDLPRILGLARKIGYSSIQITTNGLRLADPAYARRLKDLGAGIFRLSVHGHTPELHDRLVGVPGALEKVQAAAANLRGLGVRLGINYVLNKVNAPYFADTMAWFHRELRIDDVIVYLLRYQGFGALPANRELLKLSFTEAAPFVREGFRRLKENPAAKPPALIHFPPCVLPELREHMLDWTRDPEGSGEGNSRRDRVANPDGSGGLISEITNSGKRPVPACAHCSLASKCLGVEQNYLAEFGGGEFRPIERPEPAGVA